MLCTAFVAGSTTAHAGSDQEQAREYFDSGAEHFFEGRYGRALVEFRRAYRLNPHPMILYNKALTHYRLGNYDEAFERGMELMEMGGPSEREQVRNAARTRGVGVVLTAGQVGDDVAEAIEERKRRTEEQPDEPVADIDDVAEPPDVDDRRLGAMGWTGVALTGLGAGALGYATVVNFRLGGKIEDYERAALHGPEDDYDRLRTEIETDTRNGQIALYSGAGLLTIGLALWLVDGLSGGSSSYSLQVAPDLTSSSATGGVIQLGGQF